ncbi:GNAT family N-acetyltransferase [Chachezhania antarctica]|uniref:GNAT family N-acetyltransferase n=1 Tax=Chachezhania antarctica TaxID=2340860 RepID=UPI000EB2D49C|nr:GNAT family N-acyltransferase [Chachezhania antarctica]
MSVNSQVSQQGDAISVRIAETEDELRAAQALRYDVFVRELGGGGEMIDHTAGLERDRCDPYFDHLIATDTDTGAVVGVYRVLPPERAAAMGGYYSEDEYDLSVLTGSGRRLLELGRSCLHRDYRGGAVMYHLWAALADYVADHDIDILFGVASFHGTDVEALAQPLSMLHRNHLAPPDLRPRVVADHYQRMDLVPDGQLDRKAAMREIPALIKAYLRLGGFVGDGAFIDRDFNTTDICLVLDTAKLNEKQSRIYTGPRRT